MATATLKTLTPVHVGSGLTYNKGIDFVIENGEVGIIDERKVLGLIGEQNVQQWVNAIEKNEPLIDYLKGGRGMKQVTIKDFSSRISKMKCSSPTSQNLKEQYRTSIKGPCIPGSSLKGALKTAIWNDLVKAEDLKPRDLNLESFERNGKFKYKSSDKFLDTQLFGKDANSKSTRFLKIGDAHFENLETEIYEMKILNLRLLHERGEDYLEWGFKDNQQILIECLPIGKTATFELKIDHDLMKENVEYNRPLWENKLGYISNISTITNAFTKKKIEEEIAILEEYYITDHTHGERLINELNKMKSICESCKQNEFVIRVGGNSGWEFTTGGWVKGLSQENVNDADFNGIRALIQKKDYTAINLWPKTRKIATTGEIFGFVKISMED